MIACWSSTKDGVMIACWSSTKDGVMIVCWSSTKDGVMIACWSSTKDGVMIACWSSTKKTLLSSSHRMTLFLYDIAEKLFIWHKVGMATSTRVLTRSEGRVL